MIKLAITGAAGRMGRRLIALAAEDPQFRLAAATEQPGCALLGQDAGALAGVPALGVALTTEFPAAAPGVDVVVDFSAPAATRAVLQQCLQRRWALVIGTTGLSPDDHRAIDRAGQTIAVLQAPNMSLGVNLLMALSGQVARQLGLDYDIEITEVHHRFKKDAPSGTALGIAQAICQSSGRDMQKDVVYDRHGPEAVRKPGQIGLHALRLGDVVGEHSVFFAAPGERLELTHVATSRDVFARGALRAALWLSAPGRPAGRYHMSHVLGL